MIITQTTEVALDAMKTNDHNPRHITEKRMDLLIKSILTLPKMLYLRPTVVDDTDTPLGGNMRTHALKHIKNTGLDGVVKLLESTIKFQRLDHDRRCELISFWREWMARPVNPVIYASTLAPDEIQEFIVKDNTAYGEWDLDVLATEFDTAELLDIDPDLLPQSAKDLLAAASGDDLNPDDFTDDFTLASGEKQPIQQMTFTLSDLQADALKVAIAEVKDENGDRVKYMDGNKNTNGNALSIIVQQWAEQKR